MEAFAEVIHAGNACEAFGFVRPALVADSCDRNRPFAGKAENLMTMINHFS